MKRLFAGLDWASRNHAVCIIDEAGAVREQFEVTHDAAGLRELLARLRRHATTPAQLSIAIERPSGLLVDALIEAGYPIVPIHPNIVKATRPRYRSHGAKSDASDAYLLADLLRTDGARFRRCSRNPMPFVPCARWCAAAMTWSPPAYNWPTNCAACSNRSGPAPPPCSPTSTRRSRSPSCNAIQPPPAPPAAARNASPRSSPSIATAVGAARPPCSNDCAPRPPATRLQLEVEAKRTLVQALAVSLTALVEQITQLTAQIEHTVADLPDGQLVMSLPRSGRVCAAQILAELGDVRERFPTDARLAAEAGVAPLTYQSGKNSQRYLPLGLQPSPAPRPYLFR